MLFNDFAQMIDSEYVKVNIKDNCWLNTTDTIENLNKKYMNREVVRITTTPDEKMITVEVR